MSAGILVFIHPSALHKMEGFIEEINQHGRVSSEVLSLHLVSPVRASVRELCETMKMQPHLQTVERIERLKPNNAVRDLTASWRLNENFAKTHQVVLNLETVNPDFRTKYPDPNLTLPAGGIESGERSISAAHRELFEETRIKVDPNLINGNVRLFRGGIDMYTTVVYDTTNVNIYNGQLYIGSRSRIDEYYSTILPIESK